MPREFSSRFVACKLTLAASLLLHAPGALAESARLEFNRDIRPILSDKCFACHGFDANERKADLRLDIPEGAYALNDDIQAIKPGDLQSSEVWRRITSTDEDEVMPPPESNKHLTDVEKDLLKRWIEKGAQYQLHWAFVPPKKRVPPSVTGARNLIDQFIVSRLKKEGLTLSPGRIATRLPAG